MAQAGMCVIGVQTAGTPPQEKHGGGPGAAPYLRAEAGGIEDGDLVVTAGPEGLVQRQEGAHGAAPHGQAGGRLPHVPQPPCKRNGGQEDAQKGKQLETK